MSGGLILALLAAFVAEVGGEFYISQKIMAAARYRL